MFLPPAPMTLALLLIHTMPCIWGSIILSSNPRVFVGTSTVDSWPVGCWKILESHQPPCLFGNLRPGFLQFWSPLLPAKKGQHARLADDQRQAPSLATSHHSTIFQGDPVARQAEGTPARLSSVGGSFQAWQMLECNRGFSWLYMWLGHLLAPVTTLCAKQNMEPPCKSTCSASVESTCRGSGSSLPKGT